MTIHVEKWYDRRSRNWIVQKLDADGNQVGNAGIVGTRAGAEIYEAEFKKQISAPAVSRHPTRAAGHAEPERANRLNPRKTQMLPHRGSQSDK